jgi:hypothetical protein
MNINLTKHKNMPTSGRGVLLVIDDWLIVVNEGSVVLRRESYVVVSFQDNFGQ